MGQAQRQQVLMQLTDLIQTHRDEIIANWIKCVQDETEIKSSDNLTHKQLVDHMPGIFEEIAFLLPQQPEHYRLRDARTHGHYRWKQGYKLDEVLHEFGLFRIVLLESVSAFIRQIPDMTFEFEIEARKRIHKYLNDASIASAQQYAEEQDLEAERYRERLEDSEERFRLAVESAELGTWDFNPITGKLKWSDRCKAMFGLPPDEEVNYDVFLAGLHPEDRERVNQVVEQTLDPASGGKYKIEFRTVGILDGVERWITAMGRVFYNDAGQAERFIGTVSNITERKQLEATLKQKAEEAKSANRAKDEFLAVISHELRTPLTAVLGWAQLLNSGNLDEKTTMRALESIVRNVKIQVKLISDLLDIGRIVSGKFYLDVQPVNLVFVIEAALDLLQPEAQEKGIKIECILDPGIIKGDPLRLQQVVQNLLSNAIKFTSGGGQIDVQLLCSDSKAVMKVIDTGEGISPDLLPYIFDRFRQAEGASTQKQGGLGLGLAIVQHIVELHGGTVKAESKGKGQGTTFMVELPLRN